MNETQAVERMQQLIAEINRASYAYYVLDNPIMSDKEWDRLYYELLDLEKEFNLVLPDSPSQKVGGDVLDGFNKVEHTEKLYSLGKAQTLEEIIDWNTRNQNITKFEEEYSVEYKFIVDSSEIFLRPTCSTLAIGIRNVILSLSKLQA